MKKVLIAKGIFPPDIGGPATYGATIKKALEEKGFEVDVAVLSKVGRGLPKGLRHLIFFFKLLPLARKADLILALNAVSAGYPALLASKFFKKKFLVRVVGDYAWEIVSGTGKTNILIDDFQKISKRGLLHKIQTRVCRSADSVIVPSEYLKTLVVGWGVAENKIEIIYNGVDFEPLDISREEARTKIGTHGNIILSIGRLVPWKGFKMLIKIMPKLLELNQFFRLVIIGDGPERKKLELMTRNLGLDKKVYLVGKKSKDNLALYMASADMLVLNSGYEGFSHQILEAMKAGVPVVASAILGNREIIRQGENGFLVKYNDEFNLIEAIKTLHENPELKDEFVAEGKKTVAKFSVERMIDETIKLISR